MSRKLLLRQIVTLGLATVLLTGALATGARTDGGPVDLRTLRVGDVLARGAPQDGACVFPPTEAFVEASPANPVFAFQASLVEGCALVVTALCDDVAACPWVATAALPADVSTDASQRPASHCDLGPLKRLKADYWTEGYPGTSWSGVKTDMLAGTVTDMTWRYNCPGGTPHVQTLGWNCSDPGWEWHTHWCSEPGCFAATGWVCRAFQGEYECHPPNTFCSSGNLYKHWILAGVRVDNTGYGQCVYSFTGTLPPRQDGTCYYQTP